MSMPEAKSNSSAADSQSQVDSEGAPGGNNVSQKQVPSSSRDLETRRSIPAVILRQIEQGARMPGISARDYFEMFAGLVEATEAKGVIEYLWVIDMTNAIMEILFYRRMRPLVLERHRETRSDQLADRELDAALPGMLRPGIHSEAKRNTVRKTLTTPTDDAQAFVDSIQNYMQIEWLIDSAERRRDKALRDIECRQKSFAEQLRIASDAIIDGTASKDVENAK
ncbi:MAG: hypothetical protein ACO1NY_12310 [Pseudorhodoplanes sp.]